MTQQPNPNPQPGGGSWSLGGGGDSFPFDHVGDSVTGLVESMEEVQQTDMDTGEPVFWPNGSPKTMFRVQLFDTNARDPQNPGDDGRRSIYLKGSRKPETQSTLAAVLGAVKAATGNNDLQYRARLTVTFVGEKAPDQRGKSATKLYEARYEPPAMNIGEQPAQAPQQQPANGYQPQQAPAQQPYQQPAPQQAPMPQYAPQQAPQGYPAQQPAQPPAPQQAYPQQQATPPVPGFDQLSPEQQAAVRAAMAAQPQQAQPQF